MIFPKQLSAAGLDDGYIVSVVDGVSAWKKMFGFYWELDVNNDLVLKEGPFAFFFGFGLWMLEEGADVGVSGIYASDPHWEYDVDGNVLAREIV